MGGSAGRLQEEKKLNSVVFLTAKMADCCEDILFKFANNLWSGTDKNAALAEREKYEAARKKYNIAFHKHMNFCAAESYYEPGSYIVGNLENPVHKNPVFSEFFQPCDQQKLWQNVVEKMVIAGLTSLVPQAGSGLVEQARLAESVGSSQERLEDRIRYCLAGLAGMASKGMGSLTDLANLADGIVSKKTECEEKDQDTF